MRTTPKQFLIYMLIGLAAAFNFSCKKYLSEKSDQKLSTLSTVQDLQAIFDDHLNISQRNPVTIESVTDDYYITDVDWQTLNEYARRMYRWEAKNLFASGINNEWSAIYSNVYAANVVLANIDKVERSTNDQVEWNSVKGQAFFLRGQAFLQIAGIWAQAYDVATADQDLGIPLRLDPDFNKKSVRASLKQTYEQVIRDLKAAADILPVHPIHVLRPSKAGAYALLARTYLFMRDYVNAGVYSDLSLQLKSDLKDYKTFNLNQLPDYPFAPRFSNPEILIESVTPGVLPIALTIAKIDALLYDSYAEDDLRKKVFFKDNGNGTYGFRGSYSGVSFLFSGLATDEMYLTRAESYARAGNTVKAMADLNKLLENRFDPTFGPLTAGNATEALYLILKERRKELLMRGLRWMDVKRLNKEGANIAMKRILEGQTYLLAPNDLRYALPIPEDVIALTGMPQNPS